MALRITTLNQLYRKARRDRDFFDALLKNPRAAIKAKELTLPDKDLRELERALKKVYKISAKDLAAVLVSGRVSSRPWPALVYKPRLTLTKSRPWP